MVAIVNDKQVVEKSVGMPTVPQGWNVCLGTKRSEAEEFQEMTLEEIRKYWSR